MTDCSIRPGFFIQSQNIGSTGSGLHTQTSLKIFNKTFDENYDWGKDKYVTPVNLLCELLFNWTVHPFDGSFSFGSSSAYPRWKLRELAGFDDIPLHIKQKYPFNDDNRYFDSMNKLISHETAKSTLIDTRRITNACKECSKSINELQ